MKSLNKVQLIGNIGTKEQGANYTKISLAMNENYTDKQGNKVEKTEWMNVVFFGKLSEILKKYVSKGDKIYIEGSLNTSTYTDKQGNNRKSTEVIGKSMLMLGMKSKASKDETEEDDLPF